jgi:hypothetical protein
MKKKISYTIDGCFDCLDMDVYNNDIICSNKDLKEVKKIEDCCIIPDWCPLKDAEEEKPHINVCRACNSKVDDCLGCKTGENFKERMD